MSLEETEARDQAKIDRIRGACKNRNLQDLKNLAISKGGFISDELRREAWSLLLGLDAIAEPTTLEKTEVPKHRDEEQVQLDVNRSFVYYPADETEKEKNARKLELSTVIVTVLRQHPLLHYFQGYHDIVQVLLLVLGVEVAIPATARLSLLRIRDFMLPTMSGTLSHLALVPAILRAADPSLAGIVYQMPQSLGLSATMTLYSHEIEEYGSIARVFDFLLASEAVIPVYLFAAVVLSRKQQLLEMEDDDPMMLYAILSKLPPALNFEDLIHDTMRLYQHHPPETLRGRVWAKVPSSSVLKTTRDATALRAQTLQDGERFFTASSTEFRRLEALQARNERLWKLARRYRRPAVYTSVAVVVAAFAFFFRGPSSPVLSGWSMTWLKLQRGALDLLQRFTS